MSMNEFICREKITGGICISSEYVPVRPLIRCLNCIHFKQDNIPNEESGYCNLLSRKFKKFDYCSYGYAHVEVYEADDN